MNLLLFYILFLITFNVEGNDKTIVYNAKAKGVGGANEMNIMVIQVGLTNFDKSGHVITVAPPPLTVPNQIAHRVKITPDGGVIVKDNDPIESHEIEEEQIEITPDNNETRVIPEFITHYLSRSTTNDHDDIESRKFMATVIALAIGLVFLLLLAYTVSHLVHKRKKKKLMLQRQETEMEALRFKNRPRARLPYEERLITYKNDDNYDFEHDYENMDDIDEQSSIEMLRRPPPIPPRINRPRPRLYMVMDQPVSILLEKNQRNIPIRPTPRRLRQGEGYTFQPETSTTTLDQPSTSQLRRESL